MDDIHVSRVYQEISSLTQITKKWPLMNAKSLKAETFHGKIFTAVLRSNNWPM